MRKAVGHLKTNYRHLTAATALFTKLEADITNLDSNVAPPGYKRFTIGKPPQQMIHETAEDMTLTIQIPRGTSYAGIKEKLHFSFLAANARIDKAVQLAKINDLKPPTRAAAFAVHCEGLANSSISHSERLTSMNVEVPDGYCADQARLARQFADLAYLEVVRSIDHEAEARQTKLDKQNKDAADTLVKATSLKG